MRTPLYYVTTFLRNYHHIELLLDKKANVSTQDKEDVFIKILSSTDRSDDCKKELINYFNKSDFNTTDENGENPFLNLIQEYKNTLNLYSTLYSFVDTTSKKSFVNFLSALIEENTKETKLNPSSNTEVSKITEELQDLGLDILFQEN
jgi:hypothetical protein